MKKRIMHSETAYVLAMAILSIGTALMERAEEYLRANVAAKHIIGLLMADTFAEQGR